MLLEHVRQEYLRVDRIESGVGRTRQANTYELRLDSETSAKQLSGAAKKPLESRVCKVGSACKS